MDLEGTDEFPPGIRNTSVQVCLPYGEKPEEDCHKRVCPSVKALIEKVIDGTVEEADGLIGFFGRSWDLCAEGDRLTIDHVNTVALEPTTTSECEGECDGEFCDFIMNLDTFRIDPEGNHETCNQIAIDCPCNEAQEETPFISCNSGATLTSPICTANSGLRPMLRNDPNMLSIAPAQTGFAARFFSPRTIGEIYESESSIRLDIGDESKTVNATGTIEIFGRDEVSLALYIAVPDFEYAGLQVTDTTIMMETTDLISVNESGFGIINPGEAKGVIATYVNGNRTGFIDTNIAPFFIEIDRTSHKFHIHDGFTLPEEGFRPEMSVHSNIQGVLINQPPIANVGETEVVLECTSPEGVEKTLDASGSIDPNQDSLLTIWYQVAEDDELRRITQGSVVDGILPIGETALVAGVFDSHFQADFAGKRIVVQDTTPPEFPSWLERRWKNTKIQGRMW